MMYGEIEKVTPQPGDGPTEWRGYVRYPVIAGAALVALGAVMGVIADNGSGASSSTVNGIRAALTTLGLVSLGIAI